MCLEVSLEQAVEVSVSDFDIRGDGYPLDSDDFCMSSHGDEKLITGEKLTFEDFSEKPELLEQTYVLCDKVSSWQSEPVEKGEIL